MVVTNKSIYKGEDLKAEIVKKTIISYLHRILSFVALFVLCIIFIVRAEQLSSLIVGIILLVIDVLSFVFQIIQFVKIPKQISDKNEYVNCDKIDYNFTFKEQSFAVELCANGKKMKEEYYYKGIRKVTDKGDTYDILMRDGVSFYLAKDSFTVEKGLEFLHKYFDLHKVKFISKKEEEAK